MSGICGIINTDGAPVLERELEAMAHAAVHRGPDGIGYWVSGRVGFARLALEITPESAGEFRPCVDEEAGLLLCADLRLDNRQELIELMGKKGQELKAVPTDSELVMAAYRVWGLRCAEHLLGDFAFAIWDDGRQRVYAARDVMGMRALYYRIEPRRVLFATEVKQILAASGVPVRMHEQAVGAHLAGIFAPLEWSFYEGIDQLAPGTALTVERGSRHLWRYWDIDPNLRIRYADERQYEEHFLELFKQAVGCRLRSAKPVGISLSGGVDSGSVASTAGWLYQEGQLQYKPDFRAYCWAFEQLPQCDERGISNLITQRYHIPVTEVPADDAWPLNGYPDHGPDRDEPFVGIYQALIEKTLDAGKADGVGVMISGDRGDLVSGGEITDNVGLLFSLRWRSLFRELYALKSVMNASFGWAIKNDMLMPLLSTMWPPWRFRPIRERLKGKRSLTGFPRHVRPGFLKKIGIEELEAGARVSVPRLRSRSCRDRYESIFSFLHMRGMVWSERTNSRFGLSFADPWSDRRIAEYVLAIPQMLVNRVAEPKRLPKAAMDGIMPEKALRTVGKVSLQPLFTLAMKHRARNTLRLLLTDSMSAKLGFTDEKVLLDTYARFAGNELEWYDFWPVVTLEMWLRRYWQDKNR